MAAKYSFDFTGSGFIVWSPGVQPAGQVRKHAGHIIIEGKQARIGEWLGVDGVAYFAHKWLREGCFGLANGAILA